MLGDVSLNEEQMAVLKKQAEQNSQAYIALLDASENNITDIGRITVSKYSQKQR